MTCTTLELVPTFKLKFGATSEVEQHYRCANCDTHGSKKDLQIRHGLKSRPLKEIGGQDNSQKNISSPVDDFDKFWYSEQDASDNDRGDTDNDIS